MDTKYIDGIKIEFKTNKYTFVWRKRTLRETVQDFEKMHILLAQIDDNIAQDNTDISPSNFEIAKIRIFFDEMEYILYQDASKGKIDRR